MKPLDAVLLWFTIPVLVAASAFAARLGWAFAGALLNG